LREKIANENTKRGVSVNNKATKPRRPLDVEIEELHFCNKLCYRINKEMVV